MDDWTHVFMGSMAMLKIILITNCAAYKLPTVVNFIILLHLREVNHPVWRLYQHQCSLFNEEICERSLSPLAQVVNSDTQRHDLKHMTDAYRMLRHRTVLMQTMNEMLGRVRTTWEGIRLTDPDIQIAVLHLRSVIRKLVVNQYRHYTGKPEEWLNAAVAQTTLACGMPVRFFRESTSEDLKRVLGNVYARIVHADFAGTFEVSGAGVAQDPSIERNVSEGDDDTEGGGADVALEADDIADTVYEGEDKSTDAESKTKELKGDHKGASRSVQKSAPQQRGLRRMPDAHLPAHPQRQFTRTHIDPKRTALEPVLSVPLAEVQSIVASLTDQKAVVPKPAAVRPRRSAAPIVGQFAPGLQNIEILDRDSLVPISPPARRKRKFSKKK